MYRWYLPFSAGNSAPGFLETKFLNELCWRLNSPDVSPGFTQSVILFATDV
jgi:hypothetical protein